MFYTQIKLQINLSYKKNLSYKTIPKKMLANAIQKHIKRIIMTEEFIPEVQGWFIIRKCIEFIMLEKNYDHFHI